MKYERGAKLQKNKKTFGLKIQQNHLIPDMIRSCFISFFYRRIVLSQAKNMILHIYQKIYFHKQKCSQGKLYEIGVEQIFVHTRFM